MTPPRALLLGLLVMLACAQGGTLSSPTVRIDLRDRLPRKVLKKLLAVDTTYECRRKVDLRKAGMWQRFVVTWRVFDAGKAGLHFTALDVAPDGPFSGARAPKASAALGELETVTAKGQPVSRLTVQIFLQGVSGCSRRTAGHKEVIRTDDADCKPPRSLKLFKP